MGAQRRELQRCAALLRAAYNVASGCSLGLNREHELLLVLAPSLDHPVGPGGSRPASASGDEPYISASYGPKGLGR
jgi:hypothetical protein